MTMASYGSKSFLEQRIHNMLRKKTRYARVWALALACFGAGLAVCAAQVAPPKVDLAGKTSSQEISADPKLLQANGQADVQALRSQILHMQAEGIADKLAQFIKENQNQLVGPYSSRRQRAPSTNVGSTCCGFCARLPLSPSCRNLMPKARSS